MTLPWLADGAVKFLGRYINKDSVVLEFGMGNSTIWFASNAKYIVSIEHNKDWFLKVQNRLLNYPNTELILHETKAIGKTDYIEDCYAMEIDKFPNDFFDLVLVDGRNRVACFKNADRVLKTGGYMMLDNSDREEYKEVYSFYADKKYYFAVQPPIKRAIGWETAWWQK